LTFFPKGGILLVESEGTTMKLYKTQYNLYATEEEAYNECYEKITNWYKNREETKQYLAELTPIKITKKNNRTIFKYRFRYEEYGWEQVSCSYSEIEIS
jgi:hypothetical protein